MPSALTTNESSTRRVDKPAQSIVDQVAGSIMSMILTRELEPDKEFAIQDLSKWLGVSHVPVREALRRLESRGLVEFRRGKRPKVPPIAVADFENIFHLRCLIEDDVAARLSTTMSEPRIAMLEATLNEFEHILRQGNAFDVYEVHARLHLGLLPSASEWDRRLLEQLLAASERYINLYVGVSPEPATVDEIVVLHRKLVAAARSPTDLRKAVVEHIEESLRLIRPAIRAVGEAHSKRKMLVIRAQR